MARRPLHRPRPRARSLIFQPGGPPPQSAPRRPHDNSAGGVRRPAGTRDEGKDDFLAMFEPTVRLNKTLWEKIRKCADAGGYSSPEEFVTHVLEKEVSRLVDDASSNEEILRKLKGLGYLE